MRAWRTVTNAEPHGAQLREVGIPEPSAGEILVKVRAAALNRGDLMRRTDKPDPRFPEGKAETTMGLECAGEVVRNGPGGKRWKDGDAVMGRCWGGLADYAIMKEGLAMPKPDGLPWELAGTMHVFVVAHNAIYTWAKMLASESILVNAASSGVGIASIQLSRLLGSSKIVALTGSAGKEARLKDAGATTVVISTRDEFATEVLSATDGRGVDVVSDSVGASMFVENMKCLAIEGRLISIGRMGGAKTDLDLDFMALRRISLIGVTNRTRTLPQQEAMVAQFLVDVVPALADGRLKPCIDKTFAFADADAGWSMLSQNSQVGKIVLLT